MENLFVYFKDHYGISSLSEIAWAHAVNTKDRLDKFLNDSDIMMLEVDVDVCEHGEIFASHPRQHIHNLLISYLLEKIKGTRKGIKLDFKCEKAIEPTLKLLQQVKLDQPVMLSADIFKGNGFKPVINADYFLEICKKIYPEGIIAIGWTTEEGFCLSEKNIKEMIKKCEKQKEVNFPVRACSLKSSFSVINMLLENHKYTALLWNNETIAPETMKLAKKINRNKIMFDIIDKDKNPIYIKRV